MPKKLKGNILISKERYLELSVAEEYFNRLNIAGVDNWEGYYDALNSPNDVSLDDFEASQRARLTALPGA